MPLCQINTHQLFYDLTGHGPTVALMHHGTGSSRSWRRQVPALTARFQVLTIDRPGFGRSPDLAPWPFDYLRRDTDDLLALLDGLGIEQTALVGHSDGATIALLAAASQPERISKVVAEAPHVTVETPRCPNAVREAMDRISRIPIWLQRLNAIMARELCRSRSAGRTVGWTRSFGVGTSGWLLPLCGARYSLSRVPKIRSSRRHRPN